jgi:hypothetical protein
MICQKCQSSEITNIGSLTNGNSKYKCNSCDCRFVVNPRAIEVNFRKGLGDVNPYIVLVDIAVREFKSNINQTEIPNYAKKHGHPTLQTSHLDLDKLCNFVHLSHLGFINSRADALCDDILEFDTMYPNLAKKAKGDKLRKTVSVLYASNLQDKKLVENTPEHVFIDYVGETELKIVDYYRHIRNSEFHGGLSRWDHKNDLSDDSKDEIKEKYKHTPNDHDKLEPRDVILYSRVWQVIARRLCSKLVNVEKDILPKLCRKYKGKRKVRKDFAIANTLKREYFLSEKEVDELLQKLTNGWEAQ